MCYTRRKKSKGRSNAMNVEAPAAYASPEEVWTSLFDQVCERIGPCFVRPETRAGVKAYLAGLLSPIERKNGWQLAEEAGMATPYAMQYLLNRARWDSEAVREQLQGYVRDLIAGPAGLLVIDETGFLKKGNKSVGVQRQYSGTAGRMENCQIGVFLTYASQGEHTLVDRELYLPKSWTQEPERCRAAHVPETVVFATKPELAARMLWRTLDAGLTARWVTGDTVYGSHRPLRAGLEARKQAYALAVSCQEQVEVQGSRKRVDRIADGLAPEHWHRLCVGDGSKGPREFDWACVQLGKPEHEGWQRSLVVRRSLVVGEHGAERAYVLVFAPVATTLAEMATAIGTRWTVEQCFQEGKGEVGLDHYEVRSFQGWYRHITLCMLAHAFLGVLRIQSQRLLQETPETPEKKPGEPSVSLSAFKRQRGLACP
jgi:SRSO17 transposase